LRIGKKVQDYLARRKIFDDDDNRYKEFGSIGFQILKSASDPNDLTVIMDWPSIDVAQAFATSDALKEKMKNAGVIPQPEMTFLVES
jgi:hypothetical protein